MDNLRRHREILLHCQVVEYLRSLEGPRDAKFNEAWRAMVSDVPRLEPNASTGKLKISGNDIEDGAFAGSVWTDQSADGAALDGKAEIFYSRQAAEEVRDVLKCQQRHVKVPGWAWQWRRFVEVRRRGVPGEEA